MKIIFISYTITFSRSSGARNDGLVKSHKSDGTVKSSRCKACKSLGMRRTYQYAAVTKDQAQRRPSALLRAMSLSNGPSALLRAMSLSNGRWTFYEAVKNDSPHIIHYGLTRTLTSSFPFSSLIPTDDPQRVQRYSYSSPSGKIRSNFFLTGTASLQWEQ